jgi:two-component system chemotaxis response regulator CheY
MKILIVDDSPLIIMRLGEFLADLGHEVLSAPDGKHATALFESDRPDLVFMDILMPGMDGISVMKDIIAKHPRARIIIMSSMGQQSKIIEAIQFGAMDFVVKPFEPSKILLALEKASNNPS